MLMDSLTIRPPLTKPACAEPVKAYGCLWSRTEFNFQTALKDLAWWGTKPCGHDLNLQKLSEEWLPHLSANIS